MATNLRVDAVFVAIREAGGWDAVLVRRSLRREATCLKVRLGESEGEVWISDLVLMERSGDLATLLVEASRRLRGQMEPRWKVPLPHLGGT